MENLSNPIEPTTPNLIDLESENIFGDNLKHASSTSLIKQQLSKALTEQFLRGNVPLHNKTLSIL